MSLTVSSATLGASATGTAAGGGDGSAGTGRGATGSAGAAGDTPPVDASPAGGELAPGAGLTSASDGRAFGAAPASGAIWASWVGDTSASWTLPSGATSAPWGWTATSVGDFSSGPETVGGTALTVGGDGGDAGIAIAPCGPIAFA